MKIEGIPFQLTQWEDVAQVPHPGETGYALWKTLMFGTVRVRMVEYSPEYKADHWCNKGHFIYCISGEMETELKDGRKFSLKEGMTYQVGDDMDAHRTSTKNGCRLFIVD